MDNENQQNDTLFEAITNEEVIKNEDVTPKEEVKTDVKIKLPPRPVLTIEEKAQQLKKRANYMLFHVNKTKKKYRDRLLINYALMRLQQSKKNVEHYEAEILAWMEKEKQGKKGDDKS